MIRSRIKVSFCGISLHTLLTRLHYSEHLERSEGPIANQFNHFQVTTPAPPWLDCTLLRWPGGFFWLQTLWTTGISKETRTVNDGLTIPSRTGSSETWKAIAVSNIRLWSGDGQMGMPVTNHTIFSLYAMYHISEKIYTYIIYIPQVIQTNDHPLNQFLTRYPCEPQQHPNRVPTANCSTP